MNNITTQKQSAKERISLAIKILKDEKMPITLQAVQELSGACIKAIYKHNEFRPFVQFKSPRKSSDAFKSKNNIDIRINRFMKENFTSYSQDLATREISIPLNFVFSLIKFFAASGEDDARVLIKHLEMIGKCGAISEFFEKHNP